MGGSRIINALCLFFSGRDSRTLLVVDSLDEASDADEVRDRLREVDSLRSSWRVVLTSRRSSWNNQLNINEADQNHRLGDLLPSDYPDDVEAVIQQWFADKPERGQALAAQIAQRPSLQQAATVPLILAFYCILGGQQSLPEFRHALYQQVISRMLRAPWRSSRGSLPDPEACRAALRAWAWRGAKNDPDSGVGQWEDDIPTERAHLSPPGQDAVDHIAAPRGLPSFDTDETHRRFVHRSIREHLVAEHVASLPVDDAAKVLLPHLWYDLDWEYAAPAAIAKHPRHDELLRELLCRAAKSDQIPGDLSVIDAGWEFRGLLARVASESGETAWVPEAAGMIAQARVELARSARVDDLSGTAHWATSNRQAREALLGLLTGETGSRDPLRHPLRLVRGVVQLDPTAEDRRQAREALVRLLADATNVRVAEPLIRVVVQLAPTAEDRHHAREALVGLLAGATGWMAEWLVRGVVQLVPTAGDMRQAREALLGLLSRQIEVSAAAWLVSGLVQLEPAAEDRRQAREALLQMLSRQTDVDAATWLVNGLVQLAQTAEDKQQAREALLGLLSRQTGLTASQLAGGLARLDPTVEDKRQARETLLGLLAGETNARQAAWLAGGMVLLAPTAEDKSQARGALVDLLARETLDWMATILVSGVIRLAPTAEDKRQARGALVGLLAGATRGGVAAGLVRGLVQLDPTAEDERQAREALLGLLSRQIDVGAAAGLVSGLVQLDPTGEDRRLACEALLQMLSGQIGVNEAPGVVTGLVQLDPTAKDKRQAHEALLQMLSGQTDGWMAERLMDSVTQLDPTVHDLRTWRAWTFPPTPELLAAVRRNSALTDWLGVLPSLTSLSDLSAWSMAYLSSAVARWSSSEP